MFRILAFYKFCIFICLIIVILNFYIDPILKYRGQKCETLTGNTAVLYNNLTTPTVMVSLEERLKLTLKDLVIVSFTSKNHIHEAIKCCDSFQEHPQLKNTTFIMYFGDDITEEIQQLFKSLCPIAILIKLDLKQFPKYVQNLQQYRFKAIYQAMTLKKYKVVLNIDTSVKFEKGLNFNNLLKTAIKQNPIDVTLLSDSDHNMFSTIHPKMYNCFPKISKTEMFKVKQYQSGIILWISSEKAWKVMKRFVECALQRNCMGPLGAIKYCKMKDIFLFPEKFSGCHRFDQAAINLILYEESNHNETIYQWSHPGFMVDRKPEL